MNDETDIELVLELLNHTAKPAAIVQAAIAIVRQTRLELATAQEQLSGMSNAFDRRRGQVKDLLRWKSDAIACHEDLELDMLREKLSQGTPRRSALIKQGTLVEIDDGNNIYEYRAEYSEIYSNERVQGFTLNRKFLSPRILRIRNSTD